MQGFEGMVGVGAKSDKAADARAAHACVPRDEQGAFNRFGYTSPAVSGRELVCNTVQGAVVSSLTDFSCVCLFSQPPHLAPAPAVSRPLVTQSLP
jgi:hypothetical protein